MISNSTGVAPFRAFLQHKSIETKTIGSSCFGKTTLIFGCRNKEDDYIFWDEMENFVADGTLTAIFEAYSRDEVRSKEQKGLRPGHSSTQKRHDQANTVCGPWSHLHMWVL